jgi:hypothetical protein
MSLFFQRKGDWIGLLKYHPTLFEIAAQWERQSIKMTLRGYTWRKGWTLDAMREMDEQQLKLWPEPEQEPCLICTV